MGVWASYNGTMILHKEEHFSIRKSLEEHFDEICGIKITQEKINNKIHHKISFECCLDGSFAVVHFENYIKYIDTKTNFLFSVDFEVTTRVLL